MKHMNLNLYSTFQNALPTMWQETDRSLIKMMQMDGKGAQYYSGQTTQACNYCGGVLMQFVPGVIMAEDTK